jgi:hypothetical protein
LSVGSTFAAALIRFLASPDAAKTVASTGLDPITQL